MARVVGGLTRAKEQVVARSGAVTTKHPIASNAALDVLEEGGNAVDAAVVAALCIGVLLPLSTGIGGGGYLLFHDAAASQTRAIDYANESPGAAHPEMFPAHPDGGFGSSQGWRRVAGDANLRGWRSMAIPGAVAGLSHALQRWGTFSWARALQPVIALAEDGVPLPMEVSHSLLADWATLQEFPSSHRTFTDAGRPLRPAERVRYPALAKTLRRLAQAGPRDFYEGQIARDITADMAAGGGLIDATDLRQYTARTDLLPLALSYRDVTVQIAPNASGGASLLQILRLLEHVDLRAMVQGSADLIHAWDQASRLAFADRAQYLSDPEHVDVPWRGLLDPNYLASRRALLKPGRALSAFEAGDPWPFERRPRPDVRYAPSRPWEPGGTQHICLVDRWRNCVSLTDTTVGWSGVVLPRTGIVMNNAMTWHDPNPGRANSVRPHSRGLNNMSPTIIVRDGKPWAVTGARGGRKIIGTVAQVISNLVDHQMSPQDAVSVAVSDSSEPPLRLDARVTADVRAALESMGHTLAISDRGRAGAGAGAIVINPDGILQAGEDPTGESAAAGY